MTRKTKARMIVHVAVYSHRHGEDMRVFASEAGATKWREEIAHDWWHETGKPLPTGMNAAAIADQYWDHAHDENLATYELEVLP